MTKRSFIKKCVPAFLLTAALTVTFSAFYHNEGSNVDADDTVTTQSLSTEEFIASIGDTARQIAQDNDLYASVMIAQAILESNSGNSQLSQSPYYNYFGIKGDYNGNFVTMATWEDDGAGNISQVDANFRSYGNPTDSFTDYASLLSSEIYAGARKSNTTSYTDATAALTGLYATDSSYAEKLNYFIDYYGLTTYDDAANISETSTSSDYVWNSYRGSYTDVAMLEEDEAWANQSY